MAFRSNGPVILALPAFRGVTRQIILTVLGVYFAGLVLHLLLPGVADILLGNLALHAGEATSRMLWQLVTYPLVSTGLLSVLFGLLSLWFFGSALEDERGPRWLTEYLLSATVGGALIASILSRAAGYRVPGLGPEAVGASLWPAVLALLLAYARFHADQELTFNFLLRIRAKYLAALYLLLYLALALIGGDRFGALLALANGLAGFVFLRLAPRQGLRAAASEQWFAWRNDRLRAKRRRAGKKFAVYMREQGRDVNIDADGRFIAPEDLPKGPRDPSKKRWTN